MYPTFCEMVCPKGDDFRTPVNMHWQSNYNLLTKKIDLLSNICVILIILYINHVLADYIRDFAKLLSFVGVMLCGIVVLNMRLDFFVFPMDYAMQSGQAGM